MPPKGYKTITVKLELYEKLEKLLVTLNYKAGYRRYKSIQELLEYLIDKELKELES